VYFTYNLSLKYGFRGSIALSPFPPLKYVHVSECCEHYKCRSTFSLCTVVHVARLIFFFFLDNPTPRTTARQERDRSPSLTIRFGSAYLRALQRITRVVETLVSRVCLNRRTFGNGRCSPAVILWLLPIC
jgi:hypothetical protein